MTAPPNTAHVSELRTLATQPQLSDLKVDMFSERGFALAQRIAKAYASSDAIPAAFRLWQEKRVGRNTQVVENPAAMGNCLVAIEVAQAVGMSIASVMQNADVIEGKLRWSAKFVIAAINASGRFTPLRFDVQNKGPIKASYKEKTGWNEDERRYNFREITVELENLVCVAWALPAGMAFPAGVYTLADAKAAKLPVIESAPVSMKLAVEEGWYGKSGSKWQTELKHLMLQYRAGTFFGNIHAPDVVMGMGQTAEEVRDITTVEVNAAGEVTGVTTETLRRAPGEEPAAAEVVSQVNSNESTTDEAAHGATADGATGQQTEGAGQPDPDTGEITEPPLKYSDVAHAISHAADVAALDAARALIPRVEDAMHQAELNAMATNQHKRIGDAKPAGLQAAAAETTRAPASRRRASSGTSPE